MCKLFKTIKIVQTATNQSGHGRELEQGSAMSLIRSPRGKLYSVSGYESGHLGGKRAIMKPEQIVSYLPTHINP